MPWVLWNFIVSQRLLEVADAAVKAADVTLIDVRPESGSSVNPSQSVTGDVAAVEEAVKCGMAAGTEKGLALSSVVIPSPREEIFAALL
ncbi:BMC domain-containing protein [Hungatella sp.]|uniref:BMC domain-containing protein n=1 Tax=Hungatella sp. TaxID=2613924 RepID=UPI00399411C9